jgi:glycine/D-amino acid oxidase-like deaminating enzyme
VTVVDEIRREDWEVLGVEPGADLEKVHRAYHTRRGLFSEGSLATYSLLGAAERDEYLGRIDEAFMRISNAAADLTAAGPEETEDRLEIDRSLAGLRTPTDLVGDPGAYLRHHRLVSGLTLEQVSVETKVRPNLLDAIEREQWHKLPASVFVRGFVLQVARLLHMDEPEELASAFVEKMRIERGEE